MIWGRGSENVIDFFSRIFIDFAVFRICGVLNELRKLRPSYAMQDRDLRQVELHIAPWSEGCKHLSAKKVIQVLGSK